MKKKFCKVLFPAPILNRYDFSFVFGGYPQGVFLDESGLLSPLETIALKDASLEILNELKDQDQKIYQVHVDSYVSSKPLYIDSRFVELNDKPFPKRKIELPKKDEILRYMKRLVGYPYVWGGNWSFGIPQMQLWYPINKQMTLHEKANWLMQGVDCSGLLYEATQGYTPRNTSMLICFGKFLDIENKTPEQIAKIVKPLDLIVWKGHVIIVIDESFTIESRARRGGVVVTDLKKRLEQILTEDKKIPASGPQLDENSYYIKTGWI